MGSMRDRLQRPALDQNEAFGVKFCRHYGCDDSGFKRKLFWGGLHRHSVPLAFLAMPFVPGSFHSERVLIEDLWRARNRAEVREALSYYQGLQSHASSFWRIRISSRRVIRLTDRIFDAAG
jgi:hypothetical protein